ncbi:MAG: hypothetical protein WAN87_01100, partial [Thermoplasmata archaeon]
MAWNFWGRRRTIALILVLATVATAVLSIVVPWYAWTNTGTLEETTSPGHTQNVTIESQVTLNLGNQLQYTSICSNACGGEIPDTTESVVLVTDYTTVGLNNTGMLYQEMFWLPAASTAFALAGLGLAIIGQLGRPKAMVPAMMMLIVSVVLALSTPLVLATSTPNRLLSDHSSVTDSQFLALFGSQIPTNGTGPATAYFGSCQGLNCTDPAGPGFNALYGPNSSQTWGPGSGWYVAFGSGALGILALFVLIGTASDPQKPSARPHKSGGTPAEEVAAEPPPPQASSEVTPLYPPMYRPPPTIGGIE